MKGYSKYISILITIIFICLSFAGCSSDENITAETTSGTAITNTASSKQSTMPPDSSQTKQTLSETKTKNTKSDKNKTTAADVSSTTEQTTQKHTTTKKTKSKTTAKKAEKATITTTTSSSVTCSIEIECKNILSNMDSLKAGHEDFVPANGIIMSTQTVTVSNKSSVYDALKTACTKNGVSVNAQKSAYGTYIKGFNNIDEFDCGKQSGWIYTVNGSSPPKSCDKYTVLQGDSIVFSFVC